MRKTKFKLIKWYGDCIAPNGDTYIFYYGVAEWRGITWKYGSELELCEGREPRARYSLRPGSGPRSTGRGMEWVSRALQFAGSWEQQDPSFSETIYENEAGGIHWNCLQPRAKCVLELRGNQKIEGLGYLERLEMTIPPWGLPIRELHWGRFLSETDSLVWIDWRGLHSKRLVLHKGVPCSSAKIERNEILFGQDGTLRLAENVVLREGQMGKTALSTIPGLRRLLPRGILEVKECKWRSKGLLVSGGRTSHGWAIHEVVQWPA